MNKMTKHAPVAVAAAVGVAGLGFLLYSMAGNPYADRVRAGLGG
ncbi:hypothetical protein [Planktotalea arctica]